MNDNIKVGDIVIQYYGTDEFSRNNNIMHAIYLGKKDSDSLIVSEHGVLQRGRYELYKASDAPSLIDKINVESETAITKLKSQLKPTNRSAYQDEIDGKYKELKQRIINLSRSISAHSADEDDYLNDEFEDMIKEMAQLKKQIFEIKCEGKEDARKFNGSIKHEIKEIIRTRDNIIRRLNNIPSKFELLFQN